MTDYLPIGTCSLCGSAVVIPKVWMSVIPAIPTCSSCGATAAQHGPVIPMTPAPVSYAPKTWVYGEIQPFTTISWYSEPDDYG